MTTLALDGINLVLSIIGVTITILVLGGGAYAIFTTTQKDVVERRLRAWNDDLGRRVDYLEPRLQKMEAQNNLLMELHNPTARLEAMDTAAQQRHTEIIDLLRELVDLLRPGKDKG